MKNYPIYHFHIVKKESFLFEKFFQVGNWIEANSSCNLQFNQILFLCIFDEDFIHGEFSVGGGLFTSNQSLNINYKTN